MFHRLSLVAFLAWVGLGADGLSSSAYGPEEAFRALGRHSYLALPLAALMAATVLLISRCYTHIIEEFPSGGGGYVVASKLLGPRAGVVSGAALLVDYVLTVTISIAAAGDALFSLLPPTWHPARLPVQVALLMALTALNLRGLRESVLALVPVFVVFVVTHALVIGGGMLAHAAAAPALVDEVVTGYRDGITTLGLGGLLLLFFRGYSLGGGTYTGIEAVSNGLPIMREPRVDTGKRTMQYMGLSLATTASGLLICYLLCDVTPEAGKTLNAVLVDRLTDGLPFASGFVAATLLSEAALLVVAAQAGFIDGPRVLANMATDSWVPRRFASLSERLTSQNGIVLISTAALAALMYTHGGVGRLVVMYSINVFVTFSLSMLAMLRLWTARRVTHPDGRRRRITLFGVGLALCVTILAVTVFEKFSEGGWLTVLITCATVAVCFVVRRHYDRVESTVDALYRELEDLPNGDATSAAGGPIRLEPQLPTAAILVGSYGGVGIHTLLNVLRGFPGHFRQVVFLSVGVVDSGEFKGEHALEDLRVRTEEMLGRYVRLAAKLGIPAEQRLVIGTEVVSAAERLCMDVARELPAVTFFAGKLIFARERRWHSLLHNETALAIQRRLNWLGKTMVTLPIRVRAAGLR